MKIIELTNNKNINDFNNYYDRNNGTDKLQIVAFLANWCGFCEQFKPEWQKFKNMAKNKLINGIVATASDKSMGSLKCNNKINGFPTIRIFKNGKHMDYNGERDSKHLTDYVKNLESKSSIPYFKPCNKNTMKNTNKPKIKIKISQKSVPIENEVVNLSEKSSESEVDSLQTDEEKLKTAKKKIQDHIISKLKELSKKARRNLAIKKLKQQFETINETKKTDSSKETNLSKETDSLEESDSLQETNNEVMQEKKTKKRKKRKKRKKTRKPAKKKYKKKRGKRTKKKKKPKPKREKIKRKRSKKKSKAKGFKEWPEFAEN